MNEPSCNVLIELIIAFGQNKLIKLIKAFGLKELIELNELVAEYFTVSNVLNEGVQMASKMLEIIAHHPNLINECRYITDFRLVVQFNPILCPKGDHDVSIILQCNVASQNSKRAKSCGFL